MISSELRPLFILIIEIKCFFIHEKLTTILTDTAFKICNVCLVIIIMRYGCNQIESPIKYEQSASFLLYFLVLIFLWFNGVFIKTLQHITNLVSQSLCYRWISLILYEWIFSKDSTHSEQSVGHLCAYFWESIVILDNSF